MELCERQCEGIPRHSKHVHTYPPPKSRHIRPIYANRGVCSQEPRSGTPEGVYSDCKERELTGRNKEERKKETKVKKTQSKDTKLWCLLSKKSLIIKEERKRRVCFYEYSCGLWNYWGPQGVHSNWKRKKKLNLRNKEGETKETRVFMKLN